MGGIERKGKLFKVNNGGERVEVAGLDGGGRQVFIGHLEIEPLELTYPGVSGL